MKIVTTSNEKELREEIINAIEESDFDTVKYIAENDLSVYVDACGTNMASIEDVTYFTVHNIFDKVIMHTLDDLIDCLLSYNGVLKSKGSRRGNIDYTEESWKTSIYNSYIESKSVCKF